MTTSAINSDTPVAGVSYLVNSVNRLTVGQETT
jgi:hypothetical protein